MKLSAFTLIFRDIPLPAALKAVSKAFELSGTGLPPDASLWLKHEDKPIIDAANEFAWEHIQDEYEKAGVHISLYFAHDHPRDNQTLDIARRHVDAAVGLGAEESLILCPWPYRGGLGKFLAPAEYYGEVLTFTEFILPLADYAASLDHRLSFKPHCGLVSDARSAWEFAARYNHPAMRICYDATNVRFYEGIDPTCGLELAAPFVTSLCMKDHVGSRWHAEFPDPGKGEIDHKAVFNILAAAGFNGPVVVEKVEGETTEEKVRHLAEVLKYLQSIRASA
ncbi:MAG: sugar phosphate isomerase/epimerase [Planctomycetes bacterium]|nr:sugar phosphate isomerase/epimerase [Planctomycetota bacterium]